MGDIGYLAQFYLPLDIILAYCIKAKDLELLNYYLIRFITKNNAILLNELGVFASRSQRMSVTKKTKILTYLASEYFKPALPLLLQYNFTQHDQTTRSFYVDLFTFDIDQIDDKFLTFLPQIDIDSLWNKLYTFGLISKRFIANINKILNLINIKTDNNYIKILKLLTNQDFDITSFITSTTDGTIIVSPAFLSLAISVLNKPICDKLLAPLLSHSHYLTESNC